MWIASLSELPCTVRTWGGLLLPQRRKSLLWACSTSKPDQSRRAKALRKLERAQRTLHSDGLRAVARTGRGAAPSEDGYLMAAVDERVRQRVNLMARAELALGRHVVGDHGDAQRLHVA